MISYAANEVQEREGALGRRNGSPLSKHALCQWLAPRHCAAAWISSCTLFLSVQVMEDSRIRAATEPLLLHKNWVVATFVFVLWCSGLLLLENWLLSKFGPPQLQQWRLAVLGGNAGVLGVVFVVWALLRARHERQRRAALEEAGGADALLFGHGLLSSEEEVGEV